MSRNERKRFLPFLDTFGSRNKRKSVRLYRYGYQLLAVDGSIFCMGEHIIALDQHDCIWSDEGDTLDITLNMDAHTLQFMVNNDKDKTLIYSDIKPGEYRLALSIIDHEGAKFSFL